MTGTVRGYIDHLTFKVTTGQNVDGDTDFSYAATEPVRFVEVKVGDVLVLEEGGTLKEVTVTAVEQYEETDYGNIYPEHGDAFIIDGIVVSPFAPVEGDSLFFFDGTLDEDIYTHDLLRAVYARMWADPARFNALLPAGPSVPLGDQAQKFGPLSTVLINDLGPGAFDFFDDPDFPFGDAPPETQAEWFLEEMRKIVYPPAGTGTTPVAITYKSCCLFCSRHASTVRATVNFLTYLNRNSFTSILKEQKKRQRQSQELAEQQRLQQAAQRLFRDRTGSDSLDEEEVLGFWFLFALTFLIEVQRSTPAAVLHVASEKVNPSRSSSASAGSS
uniref:Uncharacterized protein n=1 Tax=Chromera velia CCMP2878 TaxID=1169474 RepID=A0A0G4GXG3_9ALVE|eukprot:Cvel_5344.t1-p1 / transcript=Cvel_5344.t1 / gene=Cvel_5344 / organism=Chromera_velia_CCMP2878 / gene_product=hypothetical protein / transcript_product=hypothetical protein / location=Cvel_scaffold247:105933-109532(-) / protein_length=329 / sequence_SO=supercontig / SO=protein_coding / is_pseudo=false